MSDLCTSCKEPLDYPSGDGCAAMAKHKEKKMSKKIHTENEVYDMLRAKLANRTQSSLADEIGLSRSYFNEIVRRLRPPSSEVLRYLGLRRHVVYVDWGDDK